MNTAKLLDLSIKQKETNGSKDNTGYVLHGQKYDNYLDNDSWQEFIDEMKTRYYPIYENYKNGSGDELGIKKIGKYPPKMASYGSSSRMIYLLSRDIPNFCVEKKLYTTVGGTANMDGNDHAHLHVMIERRTVFVFQCAHFHCHDQFQHLPRHGKAFLDLLVFESERNRISHGKRRDQAFILKLIQQV